jgi:hypothetical protein
MYVAHRFEQNSMNPNNLITHQRLTLRSTRTPPALPSALSQLLAISASFIVSVQAVPVSFIR